MPSEGYSQAGNSGSNTDEIIFLVELWEPKLEIRTQPDDLPIEFKATASDLLRTLLIDREF